MGSHNYSITARQQPRKNAQVPLRQHQDLLDFALMPIAMDIKEVAAMLVRHANMGNTNALRYADPLAVDGLSKSLREELELGTRGLTFTTKVYVPEEGVEWTEESVFRFQFFSGSQDQLFALATLRILLAGFDSRFHKCLLDACGTFFIGDPRSKWCDSNKCGNSYRVYKKRHGEYKARRLLR